VDVRGESGWVGWHCSRGYCLVYCLGPELCHCRVLVVPVSHLLGEFCWGDREVCWWEGLLIWCLRWCRIAIGRGRCRLRRR
jgi:hypothetical protein